jgi:predicted transcriptional regulator
MSDKKETISLTKEQREKAMISDCEGLILLLLYHEDDGMQSSILKKIVIKLKPDIDEAEEAFESLREEAYIRYEKQKRKWYITEDGKNFLREIATFKPNQEVKP